MSFLKKALSLAYRLRPGLTIDSNTGAPTITVDARAAAEPDSLGAVMSTVKKLAEDGVSISSLEIVDGKVVIKGMATVMPPKA